MAHKTRTIVLTSLGAALIAGLAWVSFRQEPVPVDLVIASRGPLEITVNANGQTQVRERYEISAPSSGTALRSPVRIGDPVQAGQTVVAVVRPLSIGLMDTRTRMQAEAALQEAQAAQRVAEADLHQSEESLSFAQGQYDRTQQLVTRGVASITQLETASQSLAIAEAARDAARARLEMAVGTVHRAEAFLLEPGAADEIPQVCCIEIRAPADGVVLEVASMSERPVTIGAPLLTIGDPTNLELVAGLLSVDAVRLAPGAKTYIERWGGDGVLLAELDRIDPQARTDVSALGIEEQRVDAYFALISPIDDRANFGDGFAVFLRVVEWQTEDALQIPLSAIFRDGSDWAVFIDDGGIAERRIIELGRRNGRMTQVLDGLEAGERVVVHPSDDIVPNVALVERSTQ